MTASLSELRSEHGREVIGRSIAELLERVVRATAPAYPPGEYSDAGVWNREALEDVLQDWVTDRLLSRGDLTVMLETAGSEHSLRAALTNSFSQFLINRRRRTSATNLYKRVAAMLRKDPGFAPVGRSNRAGEQLWSLAGMRVGGPSALPLGALVSIALELDDEALEVVRYGPYSLKSSPILREPRLHEFVAFLLEHAEGALSLGTIIKVLRRRFRLLAAEPVQLDEALESEEPPVPLRVERDAATQSVVSRLGLDLARALRAYETPDRDFAAAGKAIGGGRLEGEHAVSNVLALIAEYADSLEEARAIYRSVVESLFRESG
jgi:hypothetical protein